MFRRRKKRTPLAHIRELLWPSMGWKRFGRYLAHRVIRLNDSASKIARGLACGIAISFTPLPGSHIFQAMGWSWMIRGNIVASLAGTIAGNPWTFPAMWYLSWQMGTGLFTLFDLGPVRNLENIASLSDLWVLLTTHPMEVAVPWIIGGYLCAAIFWIPCFYAARGLLRVAHNFHHGHKRALRAKKGHR